MKSVITIGLMLLFYTAFSQSFPAYCVYLVRGNVMVNDISGKQKQLLQKASLFDTNTVTIGNNSELQLINKDGKFLRLAVPETFQVKKLATRFRENRPPGITPTYFKMLYEEMFDPHYDVSKIKRNSVGAVYGAASRGIKYLIYPVDYLKTAGDSLRFTWNKVSSVDAYTLNIFDENKSVAYSEIIKDTTKVISLQLLKNKGNFSWGIKEFSNNPGYETFKFQWLSVEDEVKETAAFYKRPTDDNLKDKLDFIDELEGNAFIEKAKTEYANLLKDHLDNKALADSYYIFLTSYGFDAEAKNIFLSQAKNKHR